MNEVIKKANLGVDEDGNLHVFDDSSRHWRDVKSLVSGAAVEESKWVRFSTAEVQAWMDSYPVGPLVLLPVLPSPGPGKAVLVLDGSWCVCEEQSNETVEGYLSYGFYEGNAAPGYDWVYGGTPSPGPNPYVFKNLTGCIFDQNHGDLRVLENLAVVLDPSGWTLPSVAVPMLFYIKSVVLEF